MEEGEETSKLPGKSVSMAGIEGSTGPLHPTSPGLDDPRVSLFNNPRHCMLDCIACELVRALIWGDMRVSGGLCLPPLNLQWDSNSCGSAISGIGEELDSALPVRIPQYGIVRTTSSPPNKKGVSGDACYPPENTVVFFV